MPTMTKTMPGTNRAKKALIYAISKRRYILLALLVYAAWIYNYKPNNIIFEVNRTPSHQTEHPPSNIEEEGDHRHAPLTIAEQNDWIQNKFYAADPSEQDWCSRVLQTGTYWKGPDGNKGAQFSQDVFVFRRLFFDDSGNMNKKGFYVEAGANDYMALSTTYFFDKCLGWDGLCIEPQVQYHEQIVKHRSCRLVKKCLSTEKTDMMIGGMPKHRGGGMYVKPIPESGIIGENWERVECEPLDSMLQQEERTEVDFFILDVEGAEMMLLETIKWETLSFGALLIENNKMTEATKAKLDQDMSERGYSKLHQMRIDALFAPHDKSEVRSRGEIWQPEGDIVQLQT